MIETLTIQGFKSFDMETPALTLGPLNFVVGANGSGKSNLFSALRFLKIALLEDLEAATAAFGGMEEVRNLRLREAKISKPVIFEFTLRSPAAAVRHLSAASTAEVSHLRYRLEVDLRAEDRLPVVKEETLSATVMRDGEKVQFKLHRTLGRLDISNPLVSGSMSEISQPVNELDRHKLVGATAFLGEPMAILHAYVHNWHSYALDPTAVRQPAEGNFGEGLGANGERLGAILHEIADPLHGSSAVMEGICAAVRGFVPTFQSIEPVRLPYGRTKWGFRVRESGITRLLNPESVSDGTVRLITMIVIAEWCARKSTLTMIEEPENGLHPHLTESLVGLFRAAAKDHGQFLITTHHAGFLDYLDPDELLLCARQESGNTRLRRASDAEDQKHFHDSFSLGEMWTMGLFP